MSGRPKPPRLKKWSPDGRRSEWFIFWFDHYAKKAKRTKCAAHGAVNAELRKAMLDDYVKDAARREQEMNGGGRLTQFDYNLQDALWDYLRDVDERKKLREAVGAREGLAPNSARRIHEVIGAYIGSVPAGLTTGALDATQLQGWFRSLAESRSSATVNVYRRTLRACLKWLSLKRPKLFPDFETLLPAFRQAYVKPRNAEAYTPGELQSFLAALPANQKLTFRFYALTGCRLSELIGAELVGNRVVFMSGKTGRARFVPLNEIAPKLLADLHEQMPRPYVRNTWGLRGPITPQRLRRNFTSYAAAIGIPASVCAQWQGHSVAVAERFYMQQAGRVSAATIEDAMGL